MARSTKGSSNRPATAGATTLPPAPKLAAIVTVPTQMLRHRSWHLRSVAANGWAGWVLDFVPGGLPQHLRSVAANGWAGWVLDFVPGGLPQHLRSGAANGWEGWVLGFVPGGYLQHIGAF